MLSTNNNDYDHLARERQVIELYKQGKSTRDIAKELWMSLRDISAILRNNQVNHVITDNSNDNTDSINKNLTMKNPLLTNYLIKKRSL